jgi:hypothetical protein
MPGKDILPGWVHDRIASLRLTSDLSNSAVGGHPFVLLALKIKIFSSGHVEWIIKQINLHEQAERDFGGD